MNKFILLTRGRTGSTAVMDELSKSQGICALQELFMQYNYGKKEDLEYVYNIAMPFDMWKVETGWRKRPSYLLGDTVCAKRYLDEVESLARRRGANSFGFRVLSCHLEERPYLGRFLKKRGYRVIYLTRNLVRQVLSGMVANQRGFFGVSKDFEDPRRYQIDLGEFQRLVKWERRSVAEERAWLTAKGFPFVVVKYEDFLSDRRVFYDKIFRFLELPPELPPPSDWGIAIADLRYTIANYEAVAKCAAALGLPLDS